jgi:Zn-dependent protease
MPALPEEQATVLTFTLPEVTGPPLAELVAHWGAKSGLKEQVLDHLLVAVSQVAEALGALARDLMVPGNASATVLPYSHWLTVEFQFPREIPLEPTFATPDSSPAPDQAGNFWRGLIGQHVDKAAWETRGKKVILRLTQYARREGHPCELYFLNLTPAPVSDLHLTFVSEDASLALSPHLNHAYGLSKEAAFVLQAVDGQTPARDLFRAMVQEFGLIHPCVLGNLLENLADKGLIKAGEPLVESRPGFWGRMAHRAARILAFQYSTPNPDALMDRLNRYLGWLWSVPAICLYAVLVLYSFWYFSFDLSPGEHILVQLYHTPELWHPWPLILLFWGMNLIIIIHELSHAMACKRLGGRIFGFGLMLYYGSLAAYCDTSDAWRFANKWHRVMVSFAGPFATLLMGCLFGWLNHILTQAGHPVAGVLCGTLAFLCLLMVAFNLIPFLELDGYYMLADLVEIPNLKKKSFQYLAALGKDLWQQGELPALSRKEQAVFLVYGLGSPLFALLVLTLPLYEYFYGHGQHSPHVLVFLGFFLIFLFVLQRLLLAARRWYHWRHRLLVDLKA